jgi:hypothetical protein
MRERRGACTVSVGKPEGKKPLERPKCRRKDNIKMDLQEVGMIWLRIGMGGILT